MKKVQLLYIITFAAILTGSYSTLAQSGYKDRLNQVKDLVNSNELIMIWSQGENSNNQFCYQRIYDLDLTNPGGTDSTLVRKPLQIDSSVTGNKNLAVASGNFLDDGKLQIILCASPFLKLLLQLCHGQTLTS